MDEGFYENEQIKEEFLMTSGLEHLQSILVDLDLAIRLKNAEEVGRQVEKLVAFSVYFEWDEVVDLANWIKKHAAESQFELAGNYCKFIRGKFEKKSIQVRQAIGVG